SRAFAVSQESLAIEFSGVPRDCKMNFLPSRLREVQSSEIARRPVRAVMTMPPSARIHQENLHFTRLIGASNRPIPALRFAAKHIRDAQQNARDNQDYSNRLFQIHDYLLLSAFFLQLTECPRASAPSICPASNSETRASALSR